MKRRKLRGRLRLPLGRVEGEGEEVWGMVVGGTRHGGVVVDRAQQQQGGRLGGIQGREGAVRRNGEMIREQ